MQPKSQFGSGYSAHKGSAPRSPAAQFKGFNYSAQTMRPKSQFSSSRITHKASATRFTELFSSRRPQRPRSLSSSVMKSLTAQLRPCSPRASSAQANQPMKPQRPGLRSSICPTMAIQPKSQFSSGRIAHRASAA